MRALLLMACLLVAGCASIPVPPWGPEPGSYGSVEVKFVPNFERLIEEGWRRQFGASTAGLAK
jgi:uncharacterized protein YceK